MPKVAPVQRKNEPAPAALQPSRVVAASVFLAGAALTSLLLVLEHFGGLSLPGCGAGSPCAKAAASVWGKVPVIGWPVSFLGLSYFAAMALAWTLARGKIGRELRWIAMAGGVASILFLGIMVFERLFCMYCVMTHVFNLAFVGVGWAALRGSSTPTRAGVVSAGSSAWAKPAFLLAFLVGTVALSITQSHQKQAAAAKAEQALDDSAKKIAAATAAQNNAPPSKAAPKSDGTATPSGTGDGTPSHATPWVEGGPSATGFTGRHRWGPEKAQVRIVMFTDYQCSDCQRVEGELGELMKRPMSLSVLIKQFPLSTQCNPNAPGELHANACWAARAAISAGMLYGDAAFWKMHEWLFKRKGSFTDPELRQGLDELAFERGPFVQMMESAASLAPVKADIDEGMSLGIVMTPMIFINGVELKGWNAPGALGRAVEAALAVSPPAASASEDRPPAAAERMITDWREAPVRAIPEAILRKKPLGMESATVEVVLFGDYQEQFSADADGLLRLWTTGSGNTIRYRFAHFPIDPACNPATTLKKHEQACLAAQAAEAALLLGGDEGFWKMHDWLMRHRGGVTMQSLGAACTELGIEAATFMDAMRQPEVAQRIAEDARAAASLGVQSLPLILINGKHVARWKVGSENLLPKIIDLAAEGSSK